MARKTKKRVKLSKSVGKNKIILLSVLVLGLISVVILANQASVRYESEAECLPGNPNCTGPDDDSWEGKEEDYWDGGNEDMGDNDPGAFKERIVNRKGIVTSFTTQDGNTYTYDEESGGYTGEHKYEDGSKDVWDLDKHGNPIPGSLETIPAHGLPVPVIGDLESLYNQCLHGSTTACESFNKKKADLKIACDDNNDLKACDKLVDINEKYGSSSLPTDGSKLTDSGEELLELEQEYKVKCPPGTFSAECTVLRNQIIVKQNQIDREQGGDGTAEVSTLEGISGEDLDKLKEELQEELDRMIGECRNNHNCDDYEENGDELRDRLNEINGEINSRVTELRGINNQLPDILSSVVGLWKKAEKVEKFVQNPFDSLISPLEWIIKGVQGLFKE